MRGRPQQTDAMPTYKYTTERVLQSELVVACLLHQGAVPRDNAQLPHSPAPSTSALEMESRLHYALQGKHLCLLGREAIVTDGGLELKGKGSLDTVSGSLQYRGTLMKHFNLNDHTMIGD
jgi:hypothetical protein